LLPSHFQSRAHCANNTGQLSVFRYVRPSRLISNDMYALYGFGKNINETLPHAPQQLNAGPLPPHYPRLQPASLPFSTAEPVLRHCLLQRCGAAPTLPTSTFIAFCHRLQRLDVGPLTPHHTRLSHCKLSLLLPCSKSSAIRSCTWAKTSAVPREASCAPLRRWKKGDIVRCVYS
jgi:hypothetical protein